MTLVRTEELAPGQQTAAENLQTYCGLDCCVTLEVHEEISRQFNIPPAIYQFEKALQGPYLEIMQRGFLVDQVARHQASTAIRTRLESLNNTLNQMAFAVWDRPLNPRSQPQLQEFFYRAMRLPEVWISQKGERKLSVNREVLEKLDVYLYARPFVSVILLIRDLSKQLEVLETGLDSDGRFRASYNIAGTETGRPSSSTNAFGTGGNAQNIAPGLRFAFVADSGCKIAVIDLEQVEARDVGWFCGTLLGDWSYLDACEQGDLHTNNAKRIWPQLPWTGHGGQDRLIANRNFYREFSYRDMAKRGSHLSNYMGTAWMASRALKVPLPMMEEFQARYIRGGKEIEPAFPCIAGLWQWIAGELQTTHQLVTPFGRRRHFFGRPGDDTTLREAIAFLPQSTTADRMNLGLWRVWKYMPEVQLLAQTYDSITFQFREDSDHEAILGRALELIRVELREPGGRIYAVPGEVKVGYNWMSAHDSSKPLGPSNRFNPDGLIKWKPGMKDNRDRKSGLQRVMA
jgi:hypothetical protein